MSRSTLPSHHGVAAERKREYPNETLRLLCERGSCRSFLEKAIPRGVLNLVLEAGTHAASGGNLQPYSIVKIENEDTRRTLARLCGQNFMAQAPVHLLFCIDWHRLRRWAELEVAPFTATSSFRHFWISFQDTIICAQSICTAADALGLGSVYIGTVTEFLPRLRDLCALPDGVFPVVLLCLGYPKATPAPRRKLGVKTIVHGEKYRRLEDQELRDTFNDKYPDLKVAITEKRLAEIERVCQEVHGKDFARRCIAKIKDQGYINPVQRYFGLHYRADQIPQGNERFLRLMEDFGFKWFKEFHAARGESPGGEKNRSRPR